MTVFVALLRSVNVGGTGKLAMADLKTLCEEAGFTHVKTYIASGKAFPRQKRKGSLHCAPRRVELIGKRTRDGG